MQTESIGEGWGLRLCISNELPGDADAVGSQTTLSLAMSWK